MGEAGCPLDADDKWDRCAFAASEDDLEGRVCYGGLDLSSTTDITAFVLVFPPLDEEDKYIILPYFWIPEENMALRVRRDHVPYDVWERQGFLQTTEGNVIHYGFIEKFIERLGERFNIREIAFDRWGAVQMVQNLEGMGFTVVPFGQGFKDMSPPTKELMKLVLEERIAHGGHPVLRWMMDNIYIRTDPAGNIKPDKEKSTEKSTVPLPQLWPLTGLYAAETTPANRYMTAGGCCLFSLFFVYVLKNVCAQANAFIANIDFFISRDHVACLSCRFPAEGT